MKKVIFNLFVLSTIIYSQNSCPSVPTVSYAGKIYNTVQIGSQCWLKENLDIGTMIPGSQNQTNNNIIEKYCYDNKPENCTIYGGLYQWDEAMAYDSIPGKKGICPEGWHFPTKEEVEILIATVNNNSFALKAIGQGAGSSDGTNTSGFSALLAGLISSNRSSYLKDQAYFWSSTVGRASYPYNFNFQNAGKKVYFETSGRKNSFSIRCIKD